MVFGTPPHFEAVISMTYSDSLTWNDAILYGSHKKQRHGGALFVFFLDYSWNMRVKAKSSPCTRGAPHVTSGLALGLLLNCSWITLGFRTWCGSKICWGWALTLLCPCKHHGLTAMHQKVQRLAVALDLEAKAQQHQRKLKQRLAAWLKSP